MATSVNHGVQAPNAFEATGDAQQVSLKWTTWIEEFEAYADSIGLFDMTEDSTKALLLYTAGREVKTIFKQLPEAGTVKEYKKAVDALNKHFKTKTNPIFLRHKFRQIYQLKDESISKYVIRLREATVTGAFTDNDIQIRDQDIEHCTSEKLRRKLLEKGETLTIGQILTVAALQETVSNAARSITGACCAGSWTHKQIRKGNVIGADHMTTMGKVPSAQQEGKLVTTVTVLTTTPGNVDPKRKRVAMERETADLTTSERQDSATIPECDS
ncbi:hypothetical protein V1264_007930 [Littorina saxatilis]|uniref:Retrotransposon gag domain-containing protein n=1 Tax=Littorina saxatilis TaxID=31220 RepID=A0AAN9AVS5_9CAEN